MTSNVGSELIRENSNLGFRQGIEGKTITDNDIHKKVMDALRNQFRPGISE